jgi:hypothetical protein
MILESGKLYLTTINDIVLVDEVDYSGWYVTGEFMNGVRQGEKVWWSADTYPYPIVEINLANAENYHLTSEEAPKDKFPEYYL